MDVSGAAMHDIIIELVLIAASPSLVALMQRPQSGGQRTALARASASECWLGSRRSISKRLRRAASLGRSAAARADCCASAAGRSAV